MYPFCLMMRSHAQLQTDKTSSALISTLQKTNRDTNRIKVLFQLSDFYLRKYSEDEADSSLFYLQQAMELAEATHTDKWRHEAFRRLGLCYFKKGDDKHGTENFIRIINELNDHDDKQSKWLFGKSSQSLFLRATHRG